VPTHLTRRRALRLLGAAALAALPAASAGGDASASKGWCRSDPAFLVGDRVVDVVLGSDPAMLAAATGPIELVLAVPVGVPASLLAADAGFGYGYTIAIREAADLLATTEGAQLRIAALAPATDDRLPVTIYFTSLDADGSLTQKEATGAANGWITLQGH
jgi:hypothetical protein